MFKGLASLATALTVTFLPLAIDAIRARQRARPIEIVASSEPARRFSYEVRTGVTSPLAASAESIAVVVVVTNTGAESARATVSRDCPVLFQLRAASDSAGRIVWDGRQRICPARGRDITLGPGQSDTLRTSRSVRDVLGDSLPGARYFVSAVFDVDGATLTRKAGELVLRRRAR